MKQNLKHITNLIKLARDIPKVSNARIAASIVYKRHPISYGFNQMKSHPFQAKYGKNEDCIYLHAEIDAIKNALKRLTLDQLKNSTLYVCRIKMDENINQCLGMAKPCEGCSRAIATFSIRKVLYSTDSGDFNFL